MSSIAIKHSDKGTDFGRTLTDITMYVYLITTANIHYYLNNRKKGTEFTAIKCIYCNCDFE